MPFTVFHMGPGIAFKAIRPSCFSLTVFGFTQVLIDLEPAYWMYQGAAELHRFFHTFLGALLVGVIGMLVGKPVCQLLLKFWNSRLSPDQMKYLGTDDGITWKAATGGAFIGSLSHVFFDSLMHLDIHPLAPFLIANPLLDLVSKDPVDIYDLCLLLGILGLSWMLIKSFMRKDFKTNRDLVNND